MTDALTAHPTDADSLAAFVRTRSPDAFAALAARYVDLVYTTARRLVGDSHLAEDVTQAAFIVLAKKAAHINSRTLPGWLVNTTRLAAKEALRSQRTRSKHETQAAAMRTVIQAPSDEPTAADLLPLLDDALAKLNEADRTAVVLRFLQGHSLAQVGTILDTTEEAARKRVTRAVEKLRNIFLHQGLTPTLGGLTLILATQQSPAAPAVIITSATSAAVSGSTASAVIAKGVATTATWLQIKIAAIILLSLTVLGTMAVGVVVLIANRPIVSASAPSTTLPIAIPAIPRFVAKLKIGVTVELAAIYVPSSDSADPRRGQWQLADGSGSASPPYAVPRVFDENDKPAPPQPELAVHIRAAQAGNVDVIADVTGTSSNNCGRKPTDSTPSDQLWNCLAYTGTPSTTVRFHVPSAPWTTHASVQYHNETSEILADDHTASIGGPRNHTGSGGQSTVDLTDKFPAEQLLVVAVDANGDEIKATGLSTSFRPGAVMRRSTATFPITIDKIARIDIRTRPNDQWVEFRNISLQPGVKTDVQIVTSDDPPPTAIALSQSGDVFLNGDVKRPGIYRLAKNGLTLRQLIITAGITPEAAQSDFVQLRRPDGKTVIIAVPNAPMQQVLNHADGDQSLRANDIVMVSPKSFSDTAMPGANGPTSEPAIVPAGIGFGPTTTPAANATYLIQGYVQRHGAYSLNGRIITLKQAVFFAGVDDQTLKSGKVTLQRRDDAKLKYVVENLPLAKIFDGSAEDQGLQSGDVIWVSKPTDDAATTIPTP